MTKELMRLIESAGSFHALQKRVDVLGIFTRLLVTRIFSRNPSAIRESLGRFFSHNNVLYRDNYWLTTPDDRSF